MLRRPTTPSLDGATYQCEQLKRPRVPFIRSVQTLDDMNPITDIAKKFLHPCPCLGGHRERPVLYHVICVSEEHVKITCALLAARR